MSQTKVEKIILNSLVEDGIYDKILVERTLRLENFTEDGVAYFRDSENQKYNTFPLPKGRGIQ